MSAPLEHRFFLDPYGVSRVICSPDAEGAQNMGLPAQGWGQQYPTEPFYARIAPLPPGQWGWSFADERGYVWLRSQA